MANEWVYDLKGKEVVFTGKFDGYIKDELAEIAKSLGAGNVTGWVNKSTTDPPVEVRGLR
jgi:NAD-dependent DNA ligase